MSNFLQATGSLIDTIKINDIVCRQRDGRHFWVKHRRKLSSAIIRCANAFFRAVDNPVVVFSDLDAWQRWEIDSFELLHGAEGYRAFADGRKTVWADQLPGEPLDRHAFADTLSDRMLGAAAREMKRAHGLPCEALGGRWSHGDPHMGNFIFDPATARARLIDFEVMHRPGMGEVERHADDLLVFLQDLMGHGEFPAWLGSATCFLENYRKGGGREEVLSALRRRLEPPRGSSRLWWLIRTGYIPGPERDRRIAALRAALDAS